MTDPRKSILHFTVDDVIKCKAYYYKFKNHIEQIEVYYDRNRNSTYTKDLFDVCPQFRQENIKHIIRLKVLVEPRIVSYNTPCGITLNFT